MLEVIGKLVVSVAVVVCVPGGMLYVMWRYLRPRLRKTNPAAGQAQVIRKTVGNLSSTIQ